MLRVPELLPGSLLSRVPSQLQLGPAGPGLDDFFLREREFCLLNGIAEGTYNTKHAEAALEALLYYYIHTHTYTA